MLFRSLILIFCFPVTITSEDIGLAAPSLHATISALYQSYSELKKDNKDNKPERMFLTHAVIQLCRAKKSRLVDYAMVKIWREHDKTDMPIPEYAYDMHNSRGKAMGRGVEHFYEEGAFCNNYVPQELEAEYKKEALKLHKLNPHKLKFEIRKKQSKDLFTQSPEDENEEQ